MINTTAQSRIFLGPVMPKLLTKTAMEALTWVELEEVENLGEFGDDAEEVVFKAIKDGRSRKMKGSSDAGTIELTVGRDPLDEGQQAMAAAAKTKFQYAIKIEAADAADENDDNSIFYFGALVMSGRNNFGGTDDITRTTFRLAINTEILEVASVAVA